MSDSLHVVHLCKGAVPPVGYGGIERMVFWLTREYARLGHRVTVLADAGSAVAEQVDGVRLVTLPPEGEDYRPALPPDADVLHFHYQIPLDQLPETPFLISEQGNRNHFRAYGPNTVFVSKRHMQNHGGEIFVHNGVPHEEFPLETKKRDSMVFMAKLDWRAKNAKTAINLALDTGFPLRIAGGDLWNTRKIRGRWMKRARANPALLTELGMVDGEVKLRELQESKLLFFLVNWQEPGAFAPLEALACGTPVLASPNGVLPEYIRDGENGFLVSSYKNACAAVLRIAAMDEAETAEMAHRCRASAFKVETTAQRYLELYGQVIRDRWLYPPERARSLRFRRPRSVVIKRWFG